MTGSDTSTNALFGKLQAVTADQLGINPLVTVNANTCGGVCGKMISPQSISVATAATNMVGKESEIFRFTLKHSLILCTVVGIICMLRAYVFPWIVPTVEKAAPAAAKAVAAAAAGSDGLLYLGVTFAAAVLITVMSRILGKNMVTQKARLKRFSTRSTHRGRGGDSPPSTGDPFEGHRRFQFSRSGFKFGNPAS